MSAAASMRGWIEIDNELFDLSELQSLQREQNHESTKFWVTAIFKNGNERNWYFDNKLKPIAFIDQIRKHMGLIHIPEISTRDVKALTSRINLQ